MNRWPEEDEIKLRQLWEVGKSCGQIGIALGRRYTTKAVRDKCKRMKLEPNPSQGVDLDMETITALYDKGYSPGSIAKKTGDCRNTVVAALKKSGIWQDPEPKSAVHPMWSMDEDARRIAFIEKFERGMAELREMNRA